MLCKSGVIGAAIAAMFVGGVAAADPEAAATATAVAPTTPTAPPDEARHTVYVDLLGKGGAWGAGYDYQLGSRWILGGVGSFYELGGDRFTTLAPYVGAYLLDRGRHHWFAHVGPELTRHTIPSPVPEWDGMTTNAITGELSSGYEYRRTKLVLRAYAMVAVGDHVAPTLGFSLGWRL